MCIHPAADFLRKRFPKTIPAARSKADLDRAFFWIKDSKNGKRRIYYWKQSLQKV